MSNRQTGYWLVAALMGALSGACGGSDSDPAQKPGFELLDAKGAHFGKTNAEWGIEWWKWLYQLPQTSAEACVLPPDDPTGANCGYGQSKDAPVFFLSGNFGGVSVRSACVAPAGKPLFFPILTYNADNGGVPTAQQLTPTELKASVDAWLDSIDTSTLLLKVDGKVVSNLQSYRTDPLQFAYTVPAEPNTYTCFGVPGVSGLIEPAFAAGYWIMLAGLSAGKHSIQFAGHADAGGTPFDLDVTYELTVE